MKMGIRKPSIKRSISARTTGRVKRAVKSSVNPLYGKKGMGYINDPKKAVYNKVYNKTAVGVTQALGGSSSVSRKTFDTQAALTRINQLNETASIINSTTNVSTFFSRFDFALQICDELKAYEYTGCLKNITPSQQKRDLVEQIPTAINALIVRSYNKEFAKAQELKTDKGRHNRMVRFFDNLSVELNQHGSQYITSTNIDKIHELASTIGVDNEININLTPVSLSLPKVESITPPTYSAPVQKSDKKMICPECNGIFINRTTCPDCNRTLVTENDYSSTYADKNLDSAMGSVVGCATGIYCSPLLFIGIFLWILEMYGIALIFFAIYALIIFISYSVGKQ